MRPCRFPEIAKSGACFVADGSGKRMPACRVTLREKDGRFERRLVSVVLSRPEHYLSVYQSGCNLRCRKCHSAEFSQEATGTWLSTDELARAAAAYAAEVNVHEPRSRWTMFHAEDLCRSCGSCVLRGRRSPHCPGAVRPDQVLVSGQVFGPARNLVAFTGGDLTCRPEYYAEAAGAIRERAPSLHVLVETNGAALDRQGLEILREGGVEAFWLDVKAFDPEVHRRLTGFDNRHVLAAPALMKELGFTFEVLSLFIPGLVEEDQLERIAGLVAAVDADLPFTLLTFFPTYEMAAARKPTFDEMMQAGEAVLRAGLRQVRLGNVGVFCQTEAEMREAMALGRGSPPGQKARV